MAERTHLTLAASNGTRTKNRLPARTHRRPAGARMHRKQLITGQLVALFPKSNDQGRPVVGRNPAALLPFLGTSAGNVQVRGHLGESPPLAEHIIKRAHEREYASDGLSDQAPPMIQMPTLPAMRTISPMGRSSTPARFRAEMAKRLTSARIVAGYPTKKAAADKLGITLDRYEKWESGRTPVPAQYVGPVCEIFNIDANYLFGVQAAHAVRKAV